MVLLLLLILTTAFTVGRCLQIALKNPSRMIASVAGWALVSIPIMVPVVLLTKGRGPLWWYFLDGWLFSPWVSITVLVIYVVLVPVRGIYRRALVARDEAIRLERTRLLDTDQWPELGYQEILDRVGVSNIPVHLSTDISTGYAMGIFNRKILIPVEWVPALIRGEDDFWGVISINPLPMADLRAILAHELAHHRDWAGIRTIMLELGGMLLPWEWLTGSPTNYRLMQIGHGGRRMNQKLATALTVISIGIARVGHFLWKTVVDAERMRQEMVADQGAEKVFPGAAQRFQQLRGSSHHELMRGNRVVGLSALFLASSLLIGGLLLLPGRSAWGAILGYDSPIPWMLPQGWTLTNLDISEPVNFLGYIPAKSNKPPRVRIQYFPIRNKDLWPSFISGTIWLMGGREIPEGTKLRITWIASYEGPGNFEQPDFAPPISARVELAHDPNDPLHQVGIQDYPNFQARKLGGKHFEFSEDFPFPAGKLEGRSLWFGFYCYAARPGVYELEPPTVALLLPDRDTLPLNNEWAWLIE